MDAVLYDGHCRFCISGARALSKWVPPGRVELLSFREPGVLERFPQVTLEQCDRAMQYVREDGRVSQGAEAVVQALRHRAVGRLAVAYYVPGLRQLADAAYAWVARRRFKIMGRECQDGACAIHAPR